MESAIIGHCRTLPSYGCSVLNIAVKFRRSPAEPDNGNVGHGPITVGFIMCGISLIYARLIIFLFNIDNCVSGHLGYNA